MDSMEQRLNFVTLAVADVARARDFYVDGLGWEVEFEAPGDVIFLRLGPGLVLSLWSRKGFIEEVGAEPARGLTPLTLAHNVSSPGEVDAVLAQAESAGAEVSAGVRRDWGGYSGYLVDPDGFRWEVAHNPSALGDDLIARSRTWEAARALDTAAVADALREREPLFHREPREATRDHIEAMVAPGMVHVGASGREMRRAEVVEEVTRRYAQGDHGDDHEWVVEDFAVEELAPALWAATYVLHQGARVTRRLTLWEFGGGRWRVRRHQGTEIAT